MVSLRRAEKHAAANARVDLLFYKVIEKDGKRMLKPLAIKTQIPLIMVRAILDNTIIDTFYEQLSKDLQKRGIKEGTLVQLRAKFDKSHTMINPEYDGTLMLCEVKV